jgi:Spy/CpxP family protein refolding chaperone
MKIATTFFAALLLTASLLVTAAAAAPEDWSEQAWHAHIEELRQLKQDQE